MTRTCPPLSALFALVVLVVGIPGSSHAQPARNTDVGRTHYDQGKALAASGNYAAAYLEFEAGYRLDPRPAFLFNMGEAARGMGDGVKARAAFEHYLAVEPTGPLADTARTRLADLPPSPPVANRRPPPVEPPSSPVTPVAEVRPVPASVPPAHTVTPTLQAANDPMFVRHAPASESRPLWKKWPFWAAVGGVVVAGIVVGAVATRNDGPMCGVGCIDLRP